MRIAMIGGGYVGLVSGACFAEFGVEVAVVETHPGRLEALKQGQIPIYEPGLDKLVADNIAVVAISDRSAFWITSRWQAPQASRTTR